MRDLNGTVHQKDGFTKVDLQIISHGLANIFHQIGITTSSNSGCLAKLALLLLVVVRGLGSFCSAVSCVVFVGSDSGWRNPMDLGAARVLALAFGTKTHVENRRWRSSLLSLLVVRP